MDKLIERGGEFLRSVIFENVPKILIALLILYIGWKLIKLLKKGLKKVMSKKDVDISLQGFVLTIIDILLKVLLIITVVNMIGIPITSFIAILGAAGLAIGMALQGTLQNFAGGIIILVLRPFKVGDFIEQGEFTGTVEKIQIFNTFLSTPDNKMIIVPNTQLATNTLINYTRTNIRRVDVNIGIAYGQNVDKARETMLQLANSSNLILHKPDAPAEPEVVLASLSSSSVDLSMRVWVKTDDYWTVFFSFNQMVYEKFNEEGIEIPFNQLQVHIDK